MTAGWTAGTSGCARAPPRLRSIAKGVAHDAREYGVQLARHGIEFGVLVWREDGAGDAIGDARRPVGVLGHINSYRRLDAGGNACRQHADRKVIAKDHENGVSGD